jgi:hypothetical protein
MPNPAAAVVDKRKAVDYLLNAANPDNGGKAAFFAARGFLVSNPEVLIKALLALAHENVARTTSSVHGDKYVIDGFLACPAGQASAIRTIWIVEQGAVAPRLVTAYPRE